MLIKRISNDKKLQAYIIGLALGDGNLSNPNGRAIRLRITCDKKYSILIEHIKESIQKLLPDNKVSIANRKNCVDVYCYSNHWENILGWKANSGSKFKQNVKVPDWIKKNKIYIKECLRGLFQSDGSIYIDRGYIMINLSCSIDSLAQDTIQILKTIDHTPNTQKMIAPSGKTRYIIRISKNSNQFIKDISLWKK